jgi:hypothetical protein
MNITLSFNSGAEALVLPVLPDQIEISTGLSNNSFDVISLGEIGIIGNRKLSTVKIASFFPRYYTSYCQYQDIPDPYEAVVWIGRWRDSKKPLKLSISGTPVTTNMPCMIEDFSYREKGGQPGDVYYDLSLKEYRFINARVIEQKSSGLAVSSNRPDSRQIPASYTVKNGDGLYTIAKRFYNDGTKWKQLYEKNKADIGKDPDLIKPGQVLKL